MFSERRPRRCRISRRGSLACEVVVGGGSLQKRYTRTGVCQVPMFCLLLWNLSEQIFRDESRLPGRQSTVRR